MSRLLKGLIIAAAFPAVGYVLMKATAPSQQEIDRRMQYANKVELAETRKRNREFMKVLQQTAGITDEEIKKKKG